MAAPFVPHNGGFIPQGNAAAGGGATSTGGIGTVYAGTTNETGPVLSFQNANNVSFGLNGSTITASVVPDAGIGFAVPGSTLATGTLVASNSHGVSFGLNGSTLTASIAAGATATGNFGGLGVNGAGPITNGTAILSDSNNVSFGLNGSTITASASYSQSTAPAAVQVNGSTLTNGTLVITNANNVTFGLNGSTLTASASYSQSTGPAAIQVNGSTLTNGTAVFTNGNNVSFGFNGSTITASASYSQSTAPAAIVINTEEITAGSVVFTNDNNITWGKNGNTVTASASFPAHSGPTAVQVNGSTLTDGTLVITNSNNVTFGLNGSTLTASASYSQSTAPAAIQVNGSTLTNGTLVITNSNNVSFGLNGSTLTASATFAAGGASMSALAFGLGINTVFTSYSATMLNTRLYFMRTDVPGQIVVTQAAFKATNIGAANRTLSMGLYIMTMTGSTAGTIASMSGTGEIQAGQAGWVTMTMNAVTLSAGDYLFAISKSASTDAYPAAIENFRPSTGQFGAYALNASTVGATVQLSQLTTPNATTAIQPAMTLFGTF